jgi:uncharacterized membrane protein
MRFYRNEDGSIAIVSGLGIAVLVGAVALAVDVGSIRVAERELQAAVDLAALAAAGNPNRAEALARATLSDNGEASPTSLAVAAGSYDADPNVLAASRFQANNNPVNAVRVTATASRPLYFASLFTNDDVTIAASAIAAMDAQATFSVGSRLLQLDGGILNALLSQMLGTSVSLTVVDYRAMADAKLDVLSSMDELASEINLTAGTYNELMQSEATVADLAHAMATVARRSQSPNAGLALDALAGQLGSSASFPLSHLIDLGSLGSANIGSRPPSAMSADVEALRMITAAALAANGTSQLNTNLNATIPGLTNTTLSIAIGEPPQNSPWIAVGDTGTVVRTAQVRMKLNTQIGGSGLLNGVAIKVPVFVDAAYAEARLGDITCSAGTPTNVAVDATPGVANAWIGNVSNFSDFDSSPTVSAAKLVEIPLLTISGEAHVSAGNVSAERLSFSVNDIANQTVKTATTHSYTESVFSSLLGGLNLSVKAAGLNLGLGPQKASLLKELLTNAAPAIDGVLYSSLTALGVKVGEADVVVHGARCSPAVVVQ